MGAIVPCDAVGSYSVVFLSKWEGIIDGVPRHDSEIYLCFGHGTLGLGILGVFLEVVVTIVVVIVEYLDFLELHEYVITCVGLLV